MKIPEITFEQLPSVIAALARQVTNIERILSEKEIIPEADHLLTIQEAGVTLSLSIYTLYGLVSKGEIPCMKKGKRLYFSKFELMDWVKTGRKSTSAERRADTDQYLSTLKRS